MTAGKLLTDAQRRRTAAGVDEPGPNAQWLLADAMGVERLRLLAEPDQPVGAGQKKWLFNLAADPTERKNLAAQLPDKVAALEALLDDYQLAVPASGWRDRDEVMVCSNMRAAQIHVRRHDRSQDRRIATQLLEVFK